MYLFFYDCVYRSVIMFLGGDKMIYEVKQGPTCSTLMGSIKGAYEFYHKKTMDDSMLFGLCGHVFMVNITKGIGPCAPYLWDMKQFLELCKSSVGVEVQFEDNGITKGTSESTKEEATKEIREILDEGKLVFLTSLEYQLIIGYENGKFITSKPWEDVPSVTQDLTFNTFDEINEFMSYSRILPAKYVDEKQAVLNSIKFGIGLFESPSMKEPYAMGIKAYDFWIEQMTEENANSHGNWWSSTVWWESRKLGSKYMLQIKKYFDNDDLLDELSKKFNLSSELFMKISDRESNKVKKVALIGKLKDNELAIYELLKQLNI